MSLSTHFELVFTQRIWEQTIPQILVGPAAIAVGPLRRNVCADRTELLVSQLAVVPFSNQGIRFGPLADWVAVLQPSANERRSPADWATRLQPRRGQLAAILILGQGDDLGVWDGVAVQDDRVQPLGGLRVVGSGMLQAEREPSPPEPDLTRATRVRWSRTRGALGDYVWQRVRKSHVAILGVSRTGSMAAFQFAGLGVPRLLLCDPDSIEIHQVDAMQGVTEADLGRKKVEALAERLVLQRSDLFVQGLACSATDARVVERLRCANLLVTCTDSDPPRLSAALVAHHLLKIHLEIGTGVTADESGERLIAADVRIIVPGQGCIACIGALSNQEEARHELLAPPGTLRRERTQAWRDQRAGSLVTINALAVSVGVQLWLDLLGGQLRGSHWSRLRWHPGHGLEIHGGAVAGNPDCELCGQATRPAGA